MATTRTFQSMLNEYLANEMLAEEMLKRDWFLQNVKIDQKWKGGTIPVPFRSATASSVKFGSLTAETDIAEAKYVRGSISSYKEVWGSMIFNHTDLVQHDGKLNLQSFLRVLPDQINDFLEYMRMVVSINLLCGPHFARATSNGTASGTIQVDKIDRFMLDQKVVLIDNDTAQAEYYVIGIDVNTNTVTLSASRGGAAADISAYTVAQNARFFHDGVLVAGSPVNAFTSVRNALLSAANGGSTTLHGVTKTAHPYLQAVNINGSTINAANILPSLFDAYSIIRQKAKAASLNKCVMSLKHFGTVMKALEHVPMAAGDERLGRGQFRKANDTKVSVYGYSEVDIIGPRGGFTLVGIPDMDDDVIMFLSMESMTFRTNGFFRKRQAPDGREYFEVRSTSGYRYIVDIALYGELEFTAPASNGIVHSVSYT